MIGLKKANGIGIRNMESQVKLGIRKQKINT